jgi:chemotaxis family two-component system sensor kinase Cph1
MSREVRDVGPQASPVLLLKASILSARQRRYFWLLIGAWTLAAAGSLSWNLVSHAKGVQALALQTARALFEKDLLYREWGTKHGGVYVPVSATTQPNPHLKVAERDITTPLGKALTLMNPAYMTRQVFELQNQKMGIAGHITSLKPIRPENQPDDWERVALEQFEKGKAEVSALAIRNGEQYIRMMRPLETTSGCLRCHSEQGYKIGDVRGGISVTVPMSLFATSAYRRNLVLAHAGLWLLGCFGLITGSDHLTRLMRDRERMEAERERLIGELQNALANVKTLSGLVPICAACKKIRDDKGYWCQVEQYVQDHSNAQFSHGLCNECAQKYFADAAAVAPDQPGPKAAPR